MKNGVQIKLRFNSKFASRCLSDYNERHEQQTIK